MEGVCRNPRAQEPLLNSALTAHDVIRMLDLKPHPEGGHYRQTFQDTRLTAEGRAASTAIYFLLARGERSRWHRVDAAEVWHWYAGAPLALEISGAPGEVKRVTLGGNLAAGERPQAIPASGSGRWSAARSRRASNSPTSTSRRTAGSQVRA